MWRSYLIGLGFLVVYLMTTFRYLAPVVHYQLDYTYISEVLCINRDKPQLQCQGKCQLRKNLAQLTQHQQQKEALQHLVSVYQPVEDIPHLSLLLCTPPAAAAAIPPPMAAPRTSTAILSAPFHPPRQA
ncbi:hypothetical protein [uncultured Pontibacter sp.]|uniref:hypothetical protein n=1 Tax=uncultured Pontibacter sp. TaxID=453356 RepID=UPI00262F1B21|nr:hypothetical protein [uncultured Pontibacter sp.]